MPLALLGAAIGLMLAFATPRRAGVCLALFATAALLAFFVPHGAPPPILFTGLWLSMIIAATMTYVPVAHWSRAILPASVVAGLFLGASAALAEARMSLVAGILPAFLALPASWLIRRNHVIVIRVLASWLIAIASLSVFVSLVPTPGYQADHME